MIYKGIFITGTGTDVGKSVITAALTRALWSLHGANFKAYLAIKPVQTGESSDVSLYTEALNTLNIDISPQFMPKVLHHFALPASPHLSSAKENKIITVQELCADIAHCAAQANDAPMLIEGAGGAHVPLNMHETSLDLMQELGLPVLLVMNNALGGLNHTLLSVDVLRKSGLSVVGIVCTEVEQNPDNEHITADNISFLSQYLPDIPIFPLKYLQDLNSAQNSERAQAWCEAAMILAPLAKQLVSMWQGLDFTKENEKNLELLDWDKTHIWHPYTSAINPLPVREVSHTKGMHIYVRGENEPLVDGMSSWWCAVHGYGHKKLVQAAQEQAARMAHVMFGGLTHEPALKAAKKLLALLPQSENKKLSRLFWADSGSVAVEVALKMALQYQQGRGEAQRTRFLSPRGGYYGDTLGAMSVCDPVNGMHTLFNHVLAQHIFIPRPHCPFDGVEGHFDPACLEPLEEAFNTHGEHLAAVILEPIVQGAGGMWFYDPRYIKRVHELCAAHDVLLIFDEIATGFGRTGKMFAAEWADVTPDICCVGKALTGGMMNLAATICTEQVARGICADNRVFMHGPTFMGNALACAVACASLDIFATTPWQEQVLRIEKELKQSLEPCINLEGVAYVRVLGAIGVVEMRQEVNVVALQDFFVKKRVWIRPFSRLIYIMPPYIASSEDIKYLSKAIFEAISQGVYKI